MCVGLALICGVHVSYPTSQRKFAFEGFCHHMSIRCSAGNVYGGVAEESFERSFHKVPEPIGMSGSCPDGFGFF